MFIKGMLYVRFDRGSIGELLYPTTSWGNSPGMPHVALARMQYGFQPAFRFCTFEGTPEGFKTPSGNFIKMEWATNQHLEYIVNLWNDSPIVAGTVEQWIERIKTTCLDLNPVEFERLKRIAKKSKYW